MNRNIDKLLDYVERTVKEHELAPGCYARWMIQNKEGTRDLGSSEYGCADAANILYTIGRFPRDLAVREACVKELRRMQKEDGRFEEPTHHTIHTTAHCVAALELFDALPSLPLTYHKENFGTPEKAVAFLESLGWNTNPWNESHKGAASMRRWRFVATCPRSGTMHTSTGLQSTWTKRRALALRERTTALAL